MYANVNSAPTGLGFIESRICHVTVCLNRSAKLEAPAEVRPVGAVGVRAVESCLGGHVLHRGTTPYRDTRGHTESNGACIAVITGERTPRCQFRAPLIAAAGRVLEDKLGVPPPAVSRAQLAKLVAYDWPGNVRELMNAVERAMILEQPLDIEPHAPRGQSARLDVSVRAAIEDALRATRGKL